MVALGAFPAVGVPVLPVSGRLIVRRTTIFLALYSVHLKTRKMQPRSFVIARRSRGNPGVKTRFSARYSWIATQGLAMTIV